MRKGEMHNQEYVGNKVHTCEYSSIYTFMNWHSNASQGGLALMYFYNGRRHSMILLLVLLPVNTTNTEHTDDFYLFEEAYHSRIGDL